jgi:hypothetical protein
VKRPLLVLAALLLLGVPVLAERPDTVDVTIPNARDAALGGDHVADADGFGTLLANPAGLTALPPQFTFSALTFRFTGPVFSLASIAIQGFSGGDLGSLLTTPSVQELLSSIYANVSLTGPLYFGFTGGGMGFGVINDTSFLIQNTGTTSIEARLSERFLLAGGYGIGIPLPERWQSELSLGVGLSGFVRGDSITSTSLLGLPALLESPSVALITGSPFELVSGIGVDAGLRFIWRDLLGFGITADNLYTPVAILSYDTLAGFLDSTADPGAPTYETLPQDVTVGLAFTPTLGPVERYIRDLTVTLDYRDILDFWLDPAYAENIVLKFGIGVEATLLEVLDIRAGFSEGLFSAGLGIDMSFLELNAAMYGTELSGEPGLRPLYSLIFGLEFRQ